MKPRVKMRQMPVGILKDAKIDMLEGKDLRKNVSKAFKNQIKMCVDGGETTVCSFHPPKFVLKTKCQTIPVDRVVTAAEKSGDEPEESSDA